MAERDLEQALKNLEEDLQARPGAGNLISGRFIADPPVTVSAADLRSVMAAARQSLQQQSK